MVFLKKIRLNNFISFQFQEFEFQSGRFLVLGENRDSSIAQSNGSGKSSLFSDALIFVLYGANKNERDFQREGTNDTFVELEFEYDNSTFLLKRYCKHYSEKNKVEIYKDGELQTFHTQKQAQQYINSIFKLSYENFISSIVYKQGSNLSIVNLTPTKRKEYFSNLIDNDFDRIVKNVKDDLKILDAQLKSQRDIVTEIKQNLSFVRGQYKGALQSALEDEKNESLKTQIVNLNQKIEQYNNELNDVNDKINKITEHRQKKYLEFSNKKAQYEYEYKQLVRFKDGICPLCKREVDDVDSVKQRLKQLSVAIKREFVYPYDDTYKELVAKKDELSKQIKVIDNERSKLEYQLSVSDKAKKELESLKCTINDLEEKLKIEEDKLGDYEIEFEELKQFFNLIKPSGKLRSVLLVNYIEMYNYLLGNMASSVVPEWKNVRLEFDEHSLEIKGVNYKNLSGGEKKRLELLFNLCFSEFCNCLNGFSINYRCFDEVLDGLDKASIVFILDLFANMFDEENMSVYFVSHNEEFKTFFENVLVVVKENRISSLNI